MEQLKPAIEFFKKHGFWIAVVLILLGSVGVWFTVTNDLIAQSDARASKIKGDITKVSSLQKEVDEHPNPISHEKMEAMIAARQDQVLEAWTDVYEKQKDILVWPEDLTDELKDEYREKIPIELYVEFPIPDNQKLEPFLLQQYNMYIDRTLPKIAKVADAEWTAKFDSQATGSGSMGSGMGSGAMGSGMSGGGMYEMGGGMDSSGMSGGTRDISITGVKKGPLVRWSSTAQQALITELFPWQGRNPSTLEVYYSQESLWILRQLLEIIATVNGNAKQPFEAKIREIKKLSMGSKVTFTEGMLASPAISGGMGMDGMMGMGSSAMSMDSSTMGMGTSSDSSMMGMDGMDAEEVDPADNRYVKPDHEPITGSELRAALAGDSPDDAPLKVAKRVPVMMSVRIDQRAVADLLAACGSAPLMVEVIHTRVFGSNETPTASAGSGGMGSGSGMMSSGMGSGSSSSTSSSSMGSGMGSSSMDSGMGLESGGGYGASGGDQFPLDVTVEIYGLIHVYNPPQRDKLGDEKVTAETVINGETMAEKVEGEKASAAATLESILPTPAPPSEDPTSDESAPDESLVPDAASPAPVVPAAPADSAPENAGNPAPDPVQPTADGAAAPPGT